jgi:hypothetical protein
MGVGDGVLPAAERRNRATRFSSERRYARACTLPVSLLLPVVGLIGARAP